MVVGRQDDQGQAASAVLGKVSNNTASSACKGQDPGTTQSKSPKIIMRENGKLYMALFSEPPTQD